MGRLRRREALVLGLVLAEAMLFSFGWWFEVGVLRLLVLVSRGSWGAEMGMFYIPCCLTWIMELFTSTVNNGRGSMVRVTSRRLHCSKSRG
jgi:hypothetical protein